MTYDKTYARDVLGADCDHCPLNRGGKFVGSVGPDDAKVAFVGEAPGVQEARSGEPFTGPSGRLLQIVNDSYGLKRKDVFLTNACLCRPADGTTPAKSAIAACRPRLHEELRTHGVDTVVALGNTAALSLLGVEGVTKLRVGPGRTSPYEPLQGMRIIATIHPAACLRQSDMFPSLVADVRKVVTQHEPWVEPIVRVIDDPVEAIKFLKGVQARADDVVVDIEVDIEKDTALDHPNRYGVLCVGLGIVPGEADVIGERACADDAVRDALFDALAASNIICQEGKFDLPGLYPILGPLELFFDTLLASYCLDERPGIHGLKQQAVELLGAPQYDEDIKKWVNGPTEPELEHYQGYGRIPRPILYKYNGYDVVATGRLKEMREKELATQQPDWWEETWHWEYKSLRDMHDFLVEASNELMYLELNGIAVDLDYNAQLFEMYGESLQVLEDEINGHLREGGYVDINPRSPKQVKEALAHFRITVDSTNEDTLKLILDTGKKHYGADKIDEKPVYQFVQTLLKHRREAKMFGTYVKGIRKRLYQGRIYSSYRLHGTTTGRLASRNPNMQNIPRESAIKQQFIPAK